MRGGGFGAQPDPVGELSEAGQFGCVALQPAGGQPVAHGGRIGPDPDQVHGPAAQFGRPGAPPADVVDLPGERAGQQDGAAVRADLAGGGRHPGVLVHLDVLSYHGPSRSPGGRPLAVRIAATNDPYMVSLSSRAGVGTSEASRIAATVLLPAPGGPATTHAGAGTLIRSEDTGKGHHACPPASLGSCLAMRLATTARPR